MKRKIKVILIGLIILFLTIATISMTLGKYVYNSVWNYYLSSKEFYFESDLLEVNTKNNSLLKWDGNDINFTIKNSKNNELVSEYDITYKLTCEVLGDEKEYIKCVLNDSDLSVFSGTLASEAKCINDIDNKDVINYTKSECEVSGYTWKEEIAVKNHSFNLISTDDSKKIEEVTIKLTAESIYPYSKKLIGIFNLNKIDAKDIELATHYESYSDYDEVTVTNLTNEKKCVSINFDADNYVIDIDLENVVNYKTNSNDKINEIVIELKEKSTQKYNLYKINNEKIYSINDILILEKEC